MPAKKGESGAKRGIPRRAGKRAGRIKAYYQLRYPVNKLKRILRHNGVRAAEEWAQERQVTASLIKAKKLVKESNWKKP